MKSRTVLIVDDEKNILLTLSQSLEALQLETDTATNGEEALAKLKEKDFGLILLDLRMPGMDGMEVLRKVREIRPDIHVIMITAYGTIELAVEAMKLGAVDFIQKPFSPEEIRELVSRVLDREKLDERKTTDYGSAIELAKRSVGHRHFDAAIEHLRRAIFLDPARPEAFNLLGALMEIQGDRIEAQKNYRAALSIDPSYEPAIKNLQRSTEWKSKGAIILGDVTQDQNKKIPPKEN
jgi:DNA-binding response OmpR family regulator